MDLRWYVLHIGQNCVHYIPRQRVHSFVQAVWQTVVGHDCMQCGITRTVLIHTTSNMCTIKWWRGKYKVFDVFRWLFNGRLNPLWILHEDMPQNISNMWLRDTCMWTFKTQMYQLNTFASVNLSHRFGICTCWLVVCIWYFSEGTKQNKK